MMDKCSIELLDVQEWLLFTLSPKRANNNKSKIATGDDSSNGDGNPRRISFEPPRHKDMKIHEGNSLCSFVPRWFRGFMLLLFLFQATYICKAQKEFLITSFGAKGDGKTLNTIAIQKAIDAAEKNGGKVIVPKGDFLTGPISLKNNVELHIQGKLLGSTNRLHYGEGEAIPLINASGAKNISITGKGIINGQGKALVDDLIMLLKNKKLTDKVWPVKGPSEANRPHIISFNQCNNVVVKGVTIKNGSGWVQSYVRCNGVIIDSIKVESTAYWNNDGIDIVNSKNVGITHCNINAADDAICLKSEGSVLDSCVNICITNCKLRSSANAFKIGTGSKGGFRNIKVENLEVYDTYRSAIALEAVDGAFLENVKIKNVKAINTGNAIFIRLGHRNKSDTFSTVKDIFISNVYVEVPAGRPDKGYAFEGPTLKYPQGFKPSPGVFESVSPWNNSGVDSNAIPYVHNAFPSSVSGLPGHDVENVKLENIEIVFEGGADKLKAFFPVDSLEKITEAEKSYPEFSMFGELPVWGFYVRHVKGLTMKNIRLRYKTTDFRTAMIFNDVQNLELHDVNIATAKELPVIILNKVPSPSLQNIQLPVEKSKGILVL